MLGICLSWEMIEGKEIKTQEKETCLLKSTYVVNQKKNVHPTSNQERRHQRQSEGPG